MLHMNISLFMLATAMSKYLIVCVYNSPVMNDDFVARTMFLIIYLISFSFAYIMLVIPGKVPLNYVSSKSYTFS